MSQESSSRTYRPASPLGTFQNVPGFTGINGVPLGGIGAGCIELTPDGRLANFCTNNNRHRNDRIQTLGGSFLAFAAGGERGRSLRILQTQSDLPLGAAGAGYLLQQGQIQYDGLYPKATVRYDRDALGMEVSLVAYGTVTPDDLRTSCMPAAIFEFSLHNPGPAKAWGSVMFSWENIAGCLHGVFPPGRDDIRKVERNGELLGLEFCPPPQCRENQRGSHALYVSAPTGARLSAARYNTWESGAVLPQLEDTGEFDASLWEQRFFSESRFTGAIACRVELAPGERKQVAFVLAWHYPQHRTEASEFAATKIAPCDMGHYYAAHFPDVHAVAAEALRRRGEIRKAIERWHGQIVDSSLPPWLGQMLINSLYVLSPGTLWAKDGRFSLMETPYGPMMGTLDQRFYSSVATALFFPELERTELSLFATAKHPQDRGRVYHDLGNLRFDDPKTGTTVKKWTDLNPKFVMMACRNFFWSGDRAELERLWPALREMMAYTLSQDTDGDGLPNNEDRSTTYDDWAFFGANSYASSIWLGALAAFREMSRILARPADWQPYEAVWAHACQQFEARLWDAELGYYRLYNDDRNPVFGRAVAPSGMGVSPMRPTGVSPVEEAAEQGQDAPSTPGQDASAAASAAASGMGVPPMRPTGVSPVEETAEQGQDAHATSSAADGAVNQGVVPQGPMSDHPKINRDCHDGQLAGQWFADLLGLGDLLDPGRIASAVCEIGRRNATPHGLRKGVTPQGDESPNPLSSQWWSEAGMGWPGYEVAHYAALAISRGEGEKALATVRRVHEEISHAGLVWNQPLRWSLTDGQTYGWGCDRYMNSPAAWYVYLALTGLTINRPGKELALRPRWPDASADLDLPLFTPGNWGRMAISNGSGRREIVIRFDRPEPVAVLILSAGGCSRASIPAMQGRYAVQQGQYAGQKEFRILFAEPINLGPDGLTVVLME